MNTLSAFEQQVQRAAEQAAHTLQNRTWVMLGMKGARSLQRFARSVDGLAVPGCTCFRAESQPHAQVCCWLDWLAVHRLAKLCRPGFKATPHLQVCFQFVLRKRQLVTQAVSVQERHGYSLKWPAMAGFGNLEDVKALQALNLQQPSHKA